MFKMQVVVGTVDTPAPHPEVVYDHTHVVVDDSAGATQAADLNGTEATPWTAVFDNVADGQATVTATAIDKDGNPIAGASVTTTFTGGATGGGTTFPAPTTLTVTQL